MSLAFWKRWIKKQELLKLVQKKELLPKAALWNAGEDAFLVKAKEVGVLSTEDEDIRSLRELITYGLKGLAAYSKHANALLMEDPEMDAFLQRALAATLVDSLSADDLIALTLETGKYGVNGWLFWTVPIPRPTAALKSQK